MICIIRSSIEECGIMNKILRSRLRLTISTSKVYGSNLGIGEYWKWINRNPAIWSKELLLNSRMDMREIISLARFWHGIAVFQEQAEEMQFSEHIGYFRSTTQSPTQPHGDAQLNPVSCLSIVLFQLSQIS